MSFDSQSAYLAPREHTDPVQRSADGDSESGAPKADEDGAKVPKKDEPKADKAAAKAGTTGTSAGSGGGESFFPSGGKDGEVFGDDADPAFDVDRLSLQIETANRRRTFGRLDHADEHLQRSGFAGAVRAEEADDLPGGNFEGEREISGHSPCFTAPAPAPATCRCIPCASSRRS